MDTEKGWKVVICRRLYLVLCGITLGLIAMTVIVASQEHAASEAGLGISTRSGIVTHPLGRFEFNGASGLDLPEFMEARDLPYRALWLGASQLYGINDWSPSDRTVGYRLFEHLAPKGVDLGVIGLPNATAKEHLILLASLVQRTDLDYLILSAVYDDMRHPEIRPFLAKAAEVPSTRSLIGKYAGEGLMPAGIPVGDRQSVNSVERSGQSLMFRSEALLTNALESAFGLETLRREGRAAALLALGDVRRFFESLRFRWTRNLEHYRVPIPTPAYRENLQAWEAMLQLASHRGIEVLVYVAPRPSDFFPYAPEGYQAFKRDLRRLAGRYDARFISLEDVVPPRYWGEVDITFGFPVRDPFHFKDRGHELMARALQPEIQHLIFKEAGE